MNDIARHEMRHARRPSVALARPEPPPYRECNLGFAPTSRQREWRGSGFRVHGAGLRVQDLGFRAQGYGFRIWRCVLPGVDSVGEWGAEGVAAPVEDFATCKAWIALGAEDFRVGGRQHPHLGFRVY